MPGLTTFTSTASRMSARRDNPANAGSNAASADASAPGTHARERSPSRNENN